MDRARQAAVLGLDPYGPVTFALALDLNDIANQDGSIEQKKDAQPCEYYDLASAETAPGSGESQDDSSEELEEEEVQTWNFNHTREEDPVWLSGLQLDTVSQEVPALHAKTFACWEGGTPKAQEKDNKQHCEYYYFPSEEPAPGSSEFHDDPNERIEIGAEKRTRSHILEESPLASATALQLDTVTHDVPAPHAETPSTSEGCTPRAQGAQVLPRQLPSSLIHAVPKAASRNTIVVTVSCSLLWLVVICLARKNIQREAYVPTSAQAAAMLHCKPLLLS